jgi:hypothetical protein
VSFVSHIKRFDVFAGGFETAFQPFAALGFPELVLKAVDEQNRRVATLDRNRYRFVADTLVPLQPPQRLYSTFYGDIDNLAG